MTTNHFYTSGLKFRVWRGDQWSRLLVIYYFLDLDKQHLGMEFFQLGTTLDRPQVPFGRVLTFREQLLSSDFAVHALDYRGEPIADIISRKLQEVYPGWSEYMEPVDLDVDPNKPMERTADRCAFTLETTSTLALRAARGLVRRRSSYSR